MGLKDNPIVYMSSKVWEYSKGNRKSVILYIILFLIANSMNFLQPLVIAKVFNIIQETGINSNNIHTIILYFGIFVLLSFGFWIFHGPARYVERRNGFLVRTNYKMFLINGTMDLSANWHTNHHSGDTIDKIEKGTKALFEYGSNTYEVIEAVFRLVSSYIALTYFNLHSGYIVLFMVILTIWMILKFDKVLIEQYKTLNRAENKISAKIYDIISNITTVIILRIEKLVSSAIYKKIIKPFSLFRKNIRINEIKWFLVSMCGSVMTFLVLASYIYFNYKSGILIGTLFVLYDYVKRITMIFYRFAYKYGQIVQQRTSVSNAEEISNNFMEKQKIKQFNLDNQWKKLEIKCLDFSYHGEKDADLHLKNVKMTIKQGEKIALIGQSGSGKTTFMKLMRELYHPKKIKLFIDNKELKKGFKEISSSIALIPQEPEIFNSTIKENITLGVNHTMKYIRKFTDMAMFTKVVESLPHKFNSLIVEKGVNLSGGEKQRLALARGLLACDDKEIILLDEPTSSVDSKNEIKIYENIFKYFKNKTIISSIHRLHMLKMFDRIYLFSNGKIIDSGSFNELLRSSNEFKKIWEKYNQSQKK